MDLFISKVVKIKNVGMPQDFSEWTSFISSTLRHTAPYLPGDINKQIVFEELDPNTQSAIGYIALDISGGKYYIPLIIDKGKLQPLDLVVLPNGKITGLNKDFYLGLTNKDVQVFGPAVDKRPGDAAGRMPVQYNNSPQIMKSASTRKRLEYYMVKRASFNLYDVNAHYSDGSDESFATTYTGLTKIAAPQDIEVLGVGDTRVLLPEEGVAEVSLIGQPKKVLQYNVPGTYRIIDKTKGIDAPAITGIYVYSPKELGDRGLFVTRDYYRLTSSVTGYKLSDTVFIDGTWLVPEMPLEEMVDPTTGRYALYLYMGDGGRGGIAITSVTSAIHMGDRSLYEVQAVQGKTIGLILDYGIAEGSIVKLDSQDPAVKDFYGGKPYPIYMINGGFLSIPSVEYSQVPKIKTGSYDGVKCSFSISHGTYVLKSGSDRVAGDESEVLKKFASYGVGRATYLALKRRAQVSPSVEFYIV